MEFLNALGRFVFNFESLDEIGNENGTLVFLAASAILGIMLFNKRILEINGNSNFLVVLVFWTLACVISAYLGLLFDIVNQTIQSCAIVGFSWVYILSKITSDFDKPEVVQD